LVATLRLGEIARAAAIFRVDELLIYLERNRAADRSLQKISASVLDYLATPQYIRRKAFGISPELKYAGALPPLRTPNQLVPSSESQVKVDDIRDGLVTGLRPQPRVELGLDFEFFLNAPPSSIRLGARDLFRVVDKRTRRVERAHWTDLSGYWRYAVSAPSATLGQALESHKGSLKIGTSRRGEPASNLLPTIRNLRMNKRRALIAFGSPTSGISEILAGEKINVRDAFDLTLNTATRQGVATIRTEEAILISLAVLNEVLE